MFFSLNRFNSISINKLVVLFVFTVGTLLPVSLKSELEIDYLVMQKTLQQRFPNAAASQRLKQWQQLLLAIKSKDEKQQIIEVNNFFHQRFSYKTDQALYGHDDYWATPVEFFGHGLGDCEDWVIAQYVSLRQLGIADEKLRLIYVRASIGGPYSTFSEAHMVLGYYATPNAQPLILDSLISDVLPAAERTDLKPVFSFNAEGLWAGQGSQRAKTSPTARLSPWRDTLQKMNAEGVYVNAK